MTEKPPPQAVVLIHHTALPCCIYFRIHSVMPGVFLNPSHYTAMLNLCPYVISKARTLSQSIVPHNHAALMYVHVQWDQEVVLFNCISLPNCVYVCTHSATQEVVLIHCTHYHSAFTSKHIESSQESFFLIHYTKLPYSVYFCTPLVRPGGCFNPSHHTAMLHLLAHIQ